MKKGSYRELVAPLWVSLWVLEEAVVDGGEDEGEGEDSSGSEDNGGGVECGEEVCDCLDHDISLPLWGLFPLCI